jgi:anti-sigma regulatory factor (Ser/Thr protein kinase)
MIRATTFEELRRRAGAALACWMDVLVPEQIEPLPGNRYSPRYGWMFTFERRWRSCVEEVLGHPLGALEPSLLGADGVLSESLSNAYVHGNGRCPSLPIHVVTVVGRSCLVLGIADQGQGFDVAATLAGLERGSAYYHVAGNGLRALASSAVVTAGFEAGGRVAVLHVPLDGERRATESGVVRYAASDGLS